MTMKLCIFPNDPILSYYTKGEIKSRYFNPENFFNEIHIISFIENDIDPDLVKKIAGDAILIIHSLGKLNTMNLQKKKKTVLELVKQINPDIIRAYNSRLEGWIAAYCSKHLDIPLFVSIHIQYDGYRKLIKSKNFKKYLILLYSRKFIEPFVLKNANKITGVYKIIEPYVYGIIKKNPEILYNKVDKQFFISEIKTRNYTKPHILSVSRLSPQKNHHILIHAIKDLDVHLQIIGDGELRNELQNLVKKLQIEDKVTFTTSIPNDQIKEIYQSADIFALAYDPKIEGVPIPVLEALASGMPIIIPKPIKGLSDGLEECVLFAELAPESFKEQFIKIIQDADVREKLSKNALVKASNFTIEKIESREREIYQELIDSKSTRV